VAEYFIILVVAALSTWALTPVVQRWAVRLGAVVSPDPRRVHERPTPTLGGAAMYGGFIAAMAVASVLPGFRAVFRGTSEPIGLLVGATVMFAVGALDDLRDVSPPAKLAGQVFAGSLLSLLGVTLLFFRIPFAGFVVLSPDLSPLMTVIWVAIMANAINLIDGLDGLAAGVVGIAGFAFFLYALRLSDSGLLSESNFAPLVAIIAVGVCLGFLPHNIHPARIFMGTTGSVLLGYWLATMSIIGGAKVGTAFVVLGIPILNTAWVIGRRLLAGRSPFQGGDGELLPQRMHALGLSQLQTVLVLYLICGVFGLLTLSLHAPVEGPYLTPTVAKVWLMVGMVAVMASVLLIVTYLSIRQQRARTAAPARDDRIVAVGTQSDRPASSAIDSAERSIR
jgi:UDP-GlcNAc:undecaprenyl-phosphate GlcNAc-1-phosphate transferase